MPVTLDVKRKIIGIVTLLIIFTILGSLFISEQPKRPNFTSYEMQAQKIFEDAKNQFEHIRKVVLPPNITLSVYTRQQVIERWDQNSPSLDTSNILRQENIYKSLFLMAENDTLDNAVAEWISNWVAVSVGNEIYVVYENFWPWDMPNAEAILIHELTHVWQSGIPSPTSYDVNKAYNALMEGDAVYMADYYKAQYNNSDSPNYSSNLFVLLDLPRLNIVYPSVFGIFAELNLFSYVQGKTFVSTLIDNDGWGRLNQCYSPVYAPSSTAQILHPDKYSAGKTANFVLTPVPVDDNWIRIPSSYGYLSDTYGEYFIYIMLSRWLSINQTQEVAAGWSGDSFSYYERDRDFLFVWNITWNSVQDASKFKQAFIDMLNLAQTNSQETTSWLTNGRYLTLSCNPNTKSTLILCSTNQTVTDIHFFI
jgi:hypothetical protein